MTVIIVETDNEIIKVLRDNGKKRKIRISINEINKYEIDQELLLTLTKRTGQIIEISVSNSGSGSIV